MAGAEVSTNSSNCPVIGQPISHDLSRLVETDPLARPIWQDADILDEENQQDLQSEYAEWSIHTARKNAAIKRRKKLLKEFREEKVPGGVEVTIPPDEICDEIDALERVIHEQNDDIESFRSFETLDGRHLPLDFFRVKNAEDLAANPLKAIREDRGLLDPGDGVYPDYCAIHHIDTVCLYYDDYPSDLVRERFALRERERTKKLRDVYRDGHVPRRLSEILDADSNPVVVWRDAPAGWSPSI